MSGPAPLAGVRVIDVTINVLGPVATCIPVGSPTMQNRGRTGALSLPGELAGVIDGQFGLDGTPATIR